MIVADTGGLLALLDADDRHHRAVLDCFEEEGHRWVLPWAILPELDYLATQYLGARVALDFTRDVAGGAFRVERYLAEDMKRAVTIQTAHAGLKLGLVDTVVMAQAIRLRASAIVTLDARHFRAVRLGIRPPPRLVPLDP